MNLPAPEIPRWAALAGVPPPASGENYRQYVERLGYDFHELTVDLAPHPAATAVLNLRLASRIRRSLPEQFDSYVRRWVSHVRAGYSYDDDPEDTT